MMEEAAQQEQRGLRGLQEVILPALEAPSAKQQIAIVLSRQNVPLLAREVQERMQQHFPGHLIVDFRTPGWATFGAVGWGLGRSGCVGEDVEQVAEGGRQGRW